jgi:hypothetical protein
MTPQDLPCSVSDPLLDALPEFLKEPKNFNRVQLALINTLSSCSHSEPADMVDCVKCQVAARERRRLMKELGFTSVAQYLKWRRVHEAIKKRVVLQKYNG